MTDTRARPAAAVDDVPDGSRITAELRVIADTMDHGGPVLFRATWDDAVAAWCRDAAAAIEARDAEIARLREAVDAARRAEVTAMREAVEAIDMIGGVPERRLGLRWAQARMLHALEQLEAAIP